AGPPPWAVGPPGRWPRTAARAAARRRPTGACCACPSCADRLALPGIGMGTDSSHFRFDPGLDACAEFFGGETVGMYGCADRHRDHARRLDEGLARPQFAAVDRDRHHRRAGARREPGAAGLVATLGSNPCAGAFGEQDDPAAFGKLASALSPDLLEGVGSLAAVDVNHVEQRDTPTEERNLQQLALEHVAEL